MAKAQHLWALSDARDGWIEALSLDGRIGLVPWNYVQLFEDAVVVDVPNCEDTAGSPPRQDPPIDPARGTPPDDEHGRASGTAPPFAEELAVRAT